MDRLRTYEQLVRKENEHQNLVSRGTLDVFWERHIVDSAQLVRLAGGVGRRWVDIGSGAGLPGLVIACCTESEVTLIEPRGLRADFLRRASDALGLSNVRVVQDKAQSAAGRFDAVTARAVAPLPQLLEISHHLSTRNTLYMFPKGKSAHSELCDAQRAWQGSFHLERSVTDEDSFIVVARDVRARGT